MEGIEGEGIDLRVMHLHSASHNSICWKSDIVKIQEMIIADRSKHKLIVWIPGDIHDSVLVFFICMQGRQILHQSHVQTTRPRCFTFSRAGLCLISQRQMR